MSLDSRLDRMRTPVSPGIPGASSQPSLGQQGFRFKNVPRREPGRSPRRATRELSSQLLNELLADSMLVYEHYRKYSGLVTDRSLGSLRLRLDRHAEQQRELIDLAVERVEELGGRATVPREVSELTVLPRPMSGMEDVEVLLSRLVEAHEIMIARIQGAIAATATSGDDVTNELLRDMLGRHQVQLWSITEHLVDAAAICA